MAWSFKYGNGALQDQKLLREDGAYPVPEGREAGELIMQLCPSTRGRWKPRILPSAAPQWG